MKRNIAVLIIGLASSIFLQGCYTQLAMFYPDPNIVNEEQEFYSNHSDAVLRPDISRYAQDEGSGMPLAFSSMQNRFSPFYSNSVGYNSYYNPYYMYNPYDRYGGNYYNSYGYNPYGYNYTIGGYSMFVPVGEEELRQFNKRMLQQRTQQAKTRLNISRNANSSNSSSQSSSSSYSGSKSSSSRSYGSSSSTSSGSSRSSSSSGRRTTRRN